MEARTYWCLLLWGAYLRLAGTISLRCPSAASADCQYRGSAMDEHFFDINGNEVKIDYGPEYFHLPCPENVTLDSGLLPQLDRLTAVPLVQLTGCAPPAAGYASALLALNVSVGAKLFLANVPAVPALTARHFTGLNLTTLRITTQITLRPDERFLEPLTELVDLSLKNVKLTASLLMLLPHTIRSLTLERSDVEELSGATLQRLTALRQLVVRENLLHTAQLSEAKSLRAVEISAPIATLSIGELVVNATFRGALTGPQVGGCAYVVKLNLMNVTASTVNAWLERCDRLETVRLERVRGAPGSQLLLRGARLRSLAVLASGLTAPPPAWLAGVPQLRVLALANNKIETLPRELFVPTTNLKQLDLKSNKLGPAALEAVGVARTLEALDLSFNPLGDLCGAAGDYLPNAVSSLWALRQLRSLRLVRTRATRLCADWRRDLGDLTDIDLRYNNISTLQWDELQWSRARSTTVDLRGNPLAAVRYSPRDYRAARAAPARSPPLTEMLINTPLRCDCGVYWYARAQREAPAHGSVALDALVCGGGGGEGGDDDEQHGTPLADVPLSQLQCAVPAPECPARCSCAVSGAGGELRCARAGLRAAPRVPPVLSPALLLDLAYNNITQLHVDDVQPDVVRLNLSYNHIEAMDVAVFSERRLVWLEGNPLRCDCTLRALWAVRERVPDWTRLRCAGGAALPSAAALAARCAAAAPPAGLVPALATLAVAVALAAALIVIFVTSPNARLRIKRYLLKRGLCTRWAAGALAAGEGAADEAAPDEAACEYDAFVSFAHADRARAEQLAARLEAGPRRLRVCLHQRDWLPGEMITAQIASSVHNSRRTIALVSDAFLRSKWARAEVRSALALALGARRPRLLLVLLPELADRAALARLDPALGLYAATNTYLDWADPLFWEKVDRAVPDRPEGAAAAAASSPHRQRY